MSKIPKKYQPRGFQILHEDLDVIVGVKAPGALTVAAKWNRDETIHSALNQYVRKGNPRSNKCVFVVHRLDQATSGVMVFAKSEEVMHALKDHWKSTIKNYYTIVHGKMPKKSGRIESYLEEDDNYVVHSSKNAGQGGKLAITEYEVLREVEGFSLLRVNLLTGKKNQIRVHMAGEGHPIVGDAKYGRAGASSKHKDLCLHSALLEFTHPFNGKRLRFTAPPPAYFRKYVAWEY